jgi:type IV secretory pathway TrbD component
VESDHLFTVPVRRALVEPMHVMGMDREVALSIGLFWMIGVFEWSALSATAVALALFGLARLAYALDPDFLEVAVREAAYRSHYDV